MSVIKLIEYYNRTGMNKKLLGFSDDDLRLLFFRMPDSDFKAAFSKIIDIAEGFVMNFENNMEAYYFFIKEYVFRHCSEIFQISSAVEMLGYKSTFNNLFYYLSACESAMSIANYINSKPVEYFAPECFMKNKEEVISELPSMLSFFDAFKSENKVVVTKDDYLLNTYNYLTEKGSRDLRTFEFETLRSMQKESPKGKIRRKDTDLDIVITPPVFNAFLYVEFCEGHLYASKVIDADGYHIHEIVCKDKQDKEKLIEQLLKAFPFSSFSYCDDDESIIEMITRYGFLKDEEGYMRSALKTIEYPDYYSSISKLKTEKIYTKSDIVNKVFVYNHVLYQTYLDVCCVPFDNVLKCKDKNGDNKILGVNIKWFSVMDNCRYIIYQNYCSKTGCYECFDVETGKISSFKIVQNDCDNRLPEINDIAYARKYSIETGCIVTHHNNPYFIPCLTFRENCMYLPYNVPEDALAYVGFNVITQTVIVYNCSLSEEKIVKILEQYGFGSNIKFVNNTEEVYCDKYRESLITKAKNNWHDRLKKLDNAYRLLFNKPFELVNELPVPALGSWIVSGNPYAYKALTEYLKRHNTGFNLLYIFNPKEFDELNMEIPLRKLTNNLENIHIVLEKLFEYGFSVEKIRIFYERNKDFFHKICNIDIDIDVKTVEDILTHIRKFEYLDIDAAVNYLVPNVLLYKSEMAFVVSNDDELHDIFEDLVGLKTSD